MVGAAVDHTLAHVDQELPGFPGDGGGQVVIVEIGSDR